MQKQLRIKLLLYAYAYEIHNDSLVSDAYFDKLCEDVDLEEATDRPDLDEWFKQNFDKSTGMWVHNFPEKDRLEKIYQSVIRGRTK